MQDPHSLVATFDSHEEAEDAIKELNQGGFDMTKLSIISRGLHPQEHVVGFYNTGDRMRTWGTVGACLGGTWGLLAGSALFFMPGFGAVAIAGRLVAVFVLALESAAIVAGTSALGAALVSMGIPKESVLKYETAIQSDKFLLLATGTKGDIEMAKDILQRNKARLLDMHNHMAYHGI